MLVSGLVEQVTVLTLIEELLEQQTIPGCEKIFDYIESRKTKLTVVRFRINIGQLWTE
jgi:THO complex subunit 1